jgi:benzoyl-CoA 2,3-dioxygenase component B
MDRDGKYQLRSLAESELRPARRTTQFMLTEEAHHMFVGRRASARILKRTAELMKQPRRRPAQQGGIPFEIIQKWVNLWYSLSVDLFGGEDSVQRRRLLRRRAQGPRPRERKLTEHTGLNQSYKTSCPFDANGRESRRDRRCATP